MLLLHWNIQRSRKRSDTLFQIVEKLRPYVVSVSEPPRDIVWFASIADQLGYNFHTNNRAVLLTPKNSCTTHLQTRLPDQVTVRLRDNRNFSRLFTSVYICPRTSPTAASDRIRVLTALESAYHTILGDFNKQLRPWAPVNNHFECDSHVSLIKPDSQNYTYRCVTTVSWIDAVLIPASSEIIDCSVFMPYTTDHSVILGRVRLRGVKKQPSAYLKDVSYSWRLAEQATIPARSRIVNYANYILNYPLQNWHRVCRDISTRPRAFRRILSKKRRAVRRGDWLTLQKMKLLMAKYRPTHGSPNHHLKTDKERWTFIRSHILSQGPSIQSPSDFGPSFSPALKSLMATMEKLPTLTDLPLYLHNPTSSNHEWRNVCGATISSSLIADAFSKKTWRRFFTLHHSKVRALIDLCLEHAYLPTTMRTFGVGLIPKPDNIRIRLVMAPNYLLKIYDKIVSIRLSCILEDWLLVDTQYAFRQNVDRTTAILDLQHILRSSRPYQTVTQCDINCAFDEVDTTSMLLRLRTLNHSLSLQVSALLSPRIIKLSNELGRVESKGVTQGTSCGPLLFIMCLDGAIRQLVSSGIRVIAFADDILLIHNSNVNPLPSASLYLGHIGLTLNQKKTLRHPPGEPFEFLGIMVWPKYVEAQMKRVAKDVANSLVVRTKITLQQVKYLPYRVKTLLVSGVINPSLTRLGFPLKGSKEDWMRAWITGSGPSYALIHGRGTQASLHFVLTITHLSTRMLTRVLRWTKLKQISQFYWQPGVHNYPPTSCSWAWSDETPNVTVVYKRNFRADTWTLWLAAHDTASFVLVFVPGSYYDLMLASVKIQLQAGMQIVGIPVRLLDLLANASSSPFCRDLASILPPCVKISSSPLPLLKASECDLTLFPWEEVTLRDERMSETLSVTRLKRWSNLFLDTHFSLKREAWYELYRHVSGNRRPKINITCDWIAGHHLSDWTHLLSASRNWFWLEWQDSKITRSDFIGDIELRVALGLPPTLYSLAARNKQNWKLIYEQIAMFVEAAIIFTTNKTAFL